ncbi:MAG TPA: hypothetical protein VFT29_04805 [Gemmatimonadaceae bacterium]|nr:hypothetical protein [Gemmatimonadaceae bacterium]
MNRRSIIVLLIGILSALTGFGTATVVAQRRCVGAGGHWEAALRKCQLASGELTGFESKSIVAGLFVGVFTAVLLYRMVLFFVIHRSSRPST